MKKLRELLRLKLSAQLSHRQIGQALNLSPGTVSYYAQAAIEAGLSWPLPEEWDDAVLNQRIEPLAKQLRTRPAQRAQPDWPHIHAALSQKHMTLMHLWEDYAQMHPGRCYSYAQFTRLHHAWCKKQHVTMRLEHRAGEKGFIDYAGTTVPVYSRKTGAVDFQAQIFLMVLGLSHYTFAYASRSQQLPDWIDAHQRAFRFFGGVPEILVPDNLKSGISDSCRFEPEANPTYAEMAAHYNGVIIPARPHTPRDKAVVENAVLVASRWILTRLMKQKCYSLNALNHALRELLTALNQKPFQKRQGSRYQQFMDLEKQVLRPLPEDAYEMAQLQYQTVPSDYHVWIQGHYYSVPYTAVHEKVLCRYTHSTVEILLGHQRIASHLRSFEKDQKTTLEEHQPMAHRLYQQWRPEIFLAWAQHIGPGVLEVAEFILTHQQHPQQSSKIHFGSNIWPNVLVITDSTKRVGEPGYSIVSVLKVSDPF
jgi:transposase